MVDSQVNAERERIVAALEACDYVVTRAADRLCVGKTTLGRRIRELGLDGLLEEKSRRVRRLRATLNMSVPPRATSRQAEDQAANRAKGLCSCGRPPALLDDGVTMGKMCKKCRERERRKKSRAA